MWGVTEMMVGASSGAGERGRQMSSGAGAQAPWEATGTRFCAYWTGGSASVNHPPCPLPQLLQNKGPVWRQRGARTLTPAQTQGSRAFSSLSPEPQASHAAAAAPPLPSTDFLGSATSWGTSEKRHSRMPGWMRVPAPVAKAPLAQTSLGLCPGRQTKGPQAGCPSILGALPEMRTPSAQEGAVGKRKGPK